MNSLLKWIAALVIMVLLAVSLSCMAANGTTEDVDTMPIFPLIVRGTVYDQYGEYVVGANITIFSYNSTGTKLCAKFTTTDVDGYYSATFGQNEWDYNGTIECVLCYGDVQEVETALISNEIIITIDFHLLYEIPEFGTIGGFLTVTIALAVVAYIIMRRYRR